ADTDLQGGAVADEVGDVARNALLDGTHGLGPDLRQRPRYPDQIVNSRRVDAPITIGPGQPVVDFGDNDARLLNRRVLKIISQSVTVCTVAVRRAEMNQYYIGAESAGGEIAIDLREM